MMKRMVKEKMLGRFETFLRTGEKSQATISKYLCDIRKLMNYARGREVDKGLVLSYKEKLLEEDGYKVSSINSFLAAANCFFGYMGWHDLKVKAYKVQQEAFYPENKCLSKEEYFRLVKEAKRRGKGRLAMILQTICATGIRVSELGAVTVEAVKGDSVVVHNKGKVRTVLLPDSLRKELLYYISRKGIKKGIVFCTSSGKAVDRSNVWREMKELCKEAGVEECKVFPHNLRHLFAQCFYGIKKDIVKLADILGHSSIDTTRIYTKTTSREHRKQLDQMGLVLVCREQ
ncbi:integrase [bacterium D16-51]|nr:integrase [bacterium D16-59]RKI60654.1 integrase [bacterium D16-51]